MGAEGDNCFENDDFNREYHAVSCYCETQNCNSFKAPSLTKEGKELVGRSSCLTASSLATLFGLLMTVLHEYLLVHRLP